MKKDVKKIYILILCFLFVYLAAFIGSIFTSGNTNSEWYQSIKPDITPPNWVFPVVWNILFFLIALSLYFLWIKVSKKQKPKVAILFGINLFLNILWSFLFFYLKNPTLAWIEIIFLIASTASLISFSWILNRKSAYLLMPYLIWLIFAGILNFIIAF